jgi:hypothetical protein
MKISNFKKFHKNRVYENTITEQDVTVGQPAQSSMSQSMPQAQRSMPQAQRSMPQAQRYMPQAQRYMPQAQSPRQSQMPNLTIDELKKNHKQFLDNIVCNDIKKTTAQEAFEYLNTITKPKTPTKPITPTKPGETKEQQPVKTPAKAGLSELAELLGIVHDGSNALYFEAFDKSNNDVIVKVEQYSENDHFAVGVANLSEIQSGMSDQTMMQEKRKLNKKNRINELHGDPIRSRGMNVGGGGEVEPGTRNELLGRIKEENSKRKEAMDSLNNLINNLSGHKLDDFIYQLNELQVQFSTTDGKDIPLDDSYKYRRKR